MDKYEKEICKLLKNPEFTQKMAVLETPEEMCDLFAKHGVDMPLKELEIAIANAGNANEELSADDLDNVAGGILVTPAILALIAALTARGAYTLVKTYKKKYGLK